MFSHNTNSICLCVSTKQRFYFDWQLNRRVKLGHRVTFPKVLDMSKWVTGATTTTTTTGSTSATTDGDGDGGSGSGSGETNTTNADLMYELYGVIIQSGGALGGHYFAYIQSLKDKKWYSFNDSSVIELPESNWDNAYGGDKVRGTGYVLAYRRKSMPLPTNYGTVPGRFKKLIAVK